MVMATKRNIREDEKNIDFSDTRDTFIESWNGAVDLHRVKSADLKVIGDITSHSAFSEYIRREQDIARKSCAWRRPFLDGLNQFQRYLVEFENLISDLVEQTDESNFTQIHAIDTSALWGLMYLNVHLSIDSKIKLKQNWRWLLDLRRNIELLTGTIVQCRDQNFSDDNELRLQLMEVFHPLFEVLKNSVDYLQSHYEDAEFQKEWSSFEVAAKENVGSLFEAIKHLREMMTTSRQNQASLSRLTSDVGNLRLRNPAAPAERDIFPLEILPHQNRAQYFVGREEDLKRIHAALGTDVDNALKSFTIYGRRGVGKTQLALEYARTQKTTYDAIFWVQCETRAELRQSFTAIAEALELEGTSQNVNSFDENTMRVLRWLRHTEKRWLLIYDNAEREQAEQLHQYLPDANKGAMLLTSRSPYNFFDDPKRKGETVKPFTIAESKDLLLKLLGDDWQAKHLSKEDMMHRMEETAIEILLEKTRGLPIAIFQAAKLIQDKDIGGSQTVRDFVEHFFYRTYNSLPKRYVGKRDEFVTALDAIWAIAFERLSTNARTVLSILAFMSPDSILVDLFLPSDQSKLTDILQFCRSAASDLVVQGQSIETVVKPSPALTQALEELVKQGLINKSGRSMSLHRTVREGLAYANTSWFRDCFAAAVSLMYDAFPQQHEGRPLSDSWNYCRIWVPHAVQLAEQYSRLSKKRDEDEPPLMGMKSIDLLIRLIANCAWYLYEVADYEECLNIIAIAKTATTDSNNSTFAHLLNTEGMIYYEQNRLGLARQSMEMCLAIRSELLEPDALEIANVYNNIGNLECAEGHIDTALDFHKRATDILESIGDSVAVLTGLAYLLTGRCHFLKGDYTAAWRCYQTSEGIFFKKVARNQYFTASLYFAYGNLELAQDSYEAAAREFEKARQTMRSLNPVHPLVAACLYKLACTEFERDHHTKALNYLTKAYDIADVKCGGKTNSTILRILWKKSEILEDYPLANDGEGAALADRCAVSQRVIADEQGVDLSEFMSDRDRERSYDRLVPGYFR